MQKQNLKIVIGADASYSEIVDSVADAMTGVIIIEDSLSDGFDFSDFLAAAQVQPIVTEIINDIPVFVKEFTSLNADTARAAILEAKARLVAEGRKFGKVSNGVMNFLFVSVSNFGFVNDSYKEGQRQFMLWQTFINGGDVFPVPDKGNARPVK